MRVADDARALLKIEDLTVDIVGTSGRRAVRGVSFDVRADEVTCVVGESGSGKSVTAQAVMGLLAPDELTISSGRILFRGADLLQRDVESRRSLKGREIGMIFQEPMTALNPVMRVGKQVEEVLELHTGLSPAARRARVLESFRAVLLPSPERMVSAFPFELSGGQRQRVMIAMALALEPALLIADEPTTALDVTTQAQILRLIRDLQRRLRIGVLFITHDFGVVTEVADRIVVLRHGEVVECGTAQQVLNLPRHEYTRALLAAVPGLPCDAPPSRNFEDLLLQSSHLDKFFIGRGGRKVHALDRLSLTIHSGETVGVVGESGSGKSTLGRVLAGLTSADGGFVRLGQSEIPVANVRRPHNVRKDIQMVFQDPYASLNPRHRVGDAIAQGPIAFGVPRTTALAKARQLLELVGLDAGAASRFPHQFSGGQRQRIGIARALALEPRLLIADEAVSALDVSVQAQVLELLVDIGRRMQLAILFITHDLRVAARICDRIAVMRAGAIVEIGSVSDIFFRAQDPYTQELIDAIPGRSG